FVGETGPRKQVGTRLVQRDGQHPRVVVEDRLHAVAVVGVHAHVGDALYTAVQQVLDGHGAVVVDAKTARLAPRGMVHAAGKVDRVQCRTVQNSGRGLQRGSRNPGAGGVHAGEHRVVFGAESPRFIHRRRVVADRLHRGHIGRIVDGFQLGVPG